VLTVVQVGALILSPPAWSASLPPVEAPHGMVVSAQRLASAVGLAILQRGGNAIDAAVAAGYALAVVHPCCGNLGGGGFMLIHLASGKDIVLDFRETAPLAATRDMYLDASGKVVPTASTRGYKAVGVPGTVLGLDTALKRYGSMDRAAVMAPAIALAEEGFVLSGPDSDILSTGAKTFAKEPNIAAIFLKDGKPPAAGDRLVQRDLAETLKLIVDPSPRPLSPRAAQKADFWSLLIFGDIKSSNATRSTAAIMATTSPRRPRRAPGGRRSAKS